MLINDRRGGRIRSGGEEKRGKKGKDLGEKGETWEQERGAST